jgi:CrcB protein
MVMLVAVGAAVGAPLRYLADRAVQARHDSLFPWGTFAATPPAHLFSVGWPPPACTPRHR